MKSETIEVIREIAEHCAKSDCRSCEFNEVSASSTSRFCLLRRVPANWIESGLFTHMEAEKGKIDEKPNS